MHSANAATLLVIGCTHRTVAPELRERLTVSGGSDGDIASEIVKIKEVKEFVVLNTCNRTEFYAVASSRVVVEEIDALFCSHQKLERGTLIAQGFVLQGEAAVAHAMEVASGLDSQILGETEILGQMKKAYARAQERGQVGAVLNRLFQKTFQSAKCVRSATAITQGQVSVANLGVDLCSSVFGDLSKVKILVLGAGEIAEKSAKAFQSRGAVSITFSNRTLEHARTLAESLGASVLEFDKREELLGDYDVVVCSTSAPSFVVSAEAVRRSAKARGARPLLLIDLAMPRDVESGACEAPNVFLYNLDDLAALAERNRLARIEEARKARQIIGTRALALWSHLDSQLGSERSPRTPVDANAPGMAYA